MPHPAHATSATSSANIALQIWDFQTFTMQKRLLQAFEEGRSCFPIHRNLRFAARHELQALLDQIATETGWNALRPESHSMLLSAEDLFISVYGSRKTNYCSCSFDIWASSVKIAENAREKLLKLVEKTRIIEPMFSIDWNFLTSKDELHSASIEELADDQLEDEAYPEIHEGINRFIQRYLDAKETIIVLQGPPGTGKTRLIRGILGEISRRSGGEARALYTGDKKTLESDEIFVKFITGEDDAFVIEDADHLLKPRSDGNENLHRFLTIADGVVRSQGRKIIFSTNLPNVGDLDDALIRPGRCFALIHTRLLSLDEGTRLLKKLCKEDMTLLDTAQQRLKNTEKPAFSLAEIYKTLREE